MKCSKCGTEIESGVLYCPNCGESIQLVPEYNVLEEELLSKVVEDKSKAHEDKFAEGVYANTEPAIDIKVNGSKPREIKISKAKVGLFIGSLLAIIVLIIASVLHYNATHTFEYRLELAQDAEKAENYHSALTYYAEAVSIDNSSFDAIYGLGRMYYEVKNYEDAIIQFKLALSLDNDNSEVYAYLLESYDAIGDTDSINSLASEAPNKEILDLISEYIILPPVFSLQSGEYNTNLTLYLTSSKDYSIFYTTNGKNPVTSGKLYKGSIELKDGETTVKAVCQKNGNEYSDVVSETYTISNTALSVPTPIVTPVDGIYYEPVMITIDVPTGYKAYYTWDGTDPAKGGYLYTGPFQILDGASVLWVIYKDAEGNVSQTPYIANYVYIKQ